jgi:hypothetical protein
MTTKTIEDSIIKQIEQGNRNFYKIARNIIKIFPNRSRKSVKDNIRNTIIDSNKINLTSDLKVEINNNNKKENEK